MTVLIALILLWPAFAMLCLSQARHQLTVLGRRLSARAALRLRLGGALAIAVALGVCIAGYGAGYGSIAWCGLMSVAAWAVSGLLMVRANGPRD